MATMYKVSSIFWKLICVFFSENFNQKAVTYLIIFVGTYNIVISDFKNVIFEKNRWVPSKVIKVKRSFVRSLRPNFGFQLVFTSFHLKFLSFWVSRSFDLGDLSDLRRGSGIFFKGYVFEISAFKGKKWGRSWLYRQNFY